MQLVVVTVLLSLYYFLLGLETTISLPRDTIPIPVYPNHRIVICFDFACYASSLDIAYQVHAIPVVYVTVDVAQDAYISLYVANIIDIFRYYPSAIYLLIYDIGSISLYDSMLTTVFTSLQSRKSGIVCMQHGNMLGTLQSIVTTRRHFDQTNGPMILIHLNHEQPWLTFSDSDLDRTFNSTQLLIQAYEAFSLVFRNYYYEPLLAQSYYYPVGYPYQGYLLGTSIDSRSDEDLTRFRLLSKRNIWCSFIGRAIYDEDTMNHAASTYLANRYELLNLFMNSSVCKISTRLDATTVEEVHDMVYEDYIDELKDTVFVLCPPGRNQETFRLYEALEAGAIPLFVDPVDDEMNYMRCKLS
jgi:hypothetical protein